MHPKENNKMVYLNFGLYYLHYLTHRFRLKMSVFLKIEISNWQWRLLTKLAQDVTTIPNYISHLFFYAEKS